MNVTGAREKSDFHLVGVLAIAVMLSACSLASQIPPSRTDISTPPSSASEMRPLSATEKAALAKALSRRLTNPNAAQFRWLPVAARGSGPIGYCGLVNVKTSSGEYIGFRRFFAMISKGPKGDYVSGQIEHLDGMPLDDSSTNGPEAEPGLTQENCKEWGYTDFSAAT